MADWHIRDPRMGPGQGEKIKFTVSFIKTLLGQLNGEYVLWVRE